MRLYTFPFSSASYRARIALHLKGIPYETATVNLPGGEHRGSGYTSRNPQGRVPALELDDGTVIGQSLAIIDYLEQVKPEPRLYPKDPIRRAKALSVALTVTADIHPLNNTMVVNYLRDEMGQDQAARDKWYAKWVRAGLSAIESLIDGNRYCFGDSATVADVCLIPQVFNAHRFKVDISDLTKVLAVDAVARANPAFQAAHPERQPAAV